MAIVKSYIANTQKEAFDKVKSDLGTEAVIINTRKVKKKGFMHFFKKPAIELTAVVDEHRGRAAELKTNIQSKEEIQNLIKEALKEVKLERIETQMSEVNEIVSRVHKDVDLIKRKDLAKYEPELQEIYEILKENDISEDNALRITREASEIAQEEETDINSAVEKVLFNYIGEPSPINLAVGHKKVIFFVGPTGVGKTTTLAKIAAEFSLQHNKKVCIITEDTYRIGAVEQLRIYADILDVPLYVIYSPEEIKQKIDSIENAELILVDTAGKNSIDKAYHATIKAMIDICNVNEVHLVISATTGYSTAIQIIKNYTFIKDYKIIFTKLDECAKWGVIFDIKMLLEKPLSYITIGQNVAGDILTADPEFIINNLFGGVKDGSGAPASQDCSNAKREQSIK